MSSLIHAALALRPLPVLGVVRHEDHARPVLPALSPLGPNSTENFQPNSWLEIIFRNLIGTKTNLSYYEVNVSY